MEKYINNSRNLHHTLNNEPSSSKQTSISEILDTFRNKSISKIKPEYIQQNIKPKNTKLSYQQTDIKIAPNKSKNDIKMYYHSMTPIQLKPILVKITGLTHLVKMLNGSIMKGQESYELIHGTRIILDNDNKCRSRRGPNQELYEQIDKRSKHIYRWFKVKKIENTDVKNENLFIRDETFESIEGNHMSTKRPANIDASHRLRVPQSKTYDYVVPSVHSTQQKAKVKAIQEAMQKILLEKEKDKHNDNGELVKQCIERFSQMIGEQLGGTCIAILYGSYATGSQKEALGDKPGSDIDVMFSCDNQTYAIYGKDLLTIISSFLKGLHNLVNATIDDEVPSESKHLICANEMMKAAQAGIFYPQGTDKKPMIHPLKFFLEKVVDFSTTSQTKTESQRFTKDFLSSEYLRLRLIFNILTSPNIVYSNNDDAVKQLEEVWLKSLRKLSEDIKTKLNGEPGKSGVEHLLKDTHNGGENEGEMFLGYKRERKGVIEHLKKLLNIT